MTTIKHPADNTTGNVITKVRNGKVYTTENAEKIGSTANNRRTLYRTPNGRFFLVIETRKCNLVPISRDAASRWVAMYCPDAAARLAELGIHPSDGEFVLLADYREGVCGKKNYIHRAVFKQTDGNEYIVAVSEADLSDYMFMKKFVELSQIPARETVTASGVEGVEDFEEEMYACDMTEAEVKRWAEDRLPADTYIKCFGHVEDA